MNNNEKKERENPRRGEHVTRNKRKSRYGRGDKQ